MAIGCSYTKNANKIKDQFHNQLVRSNNEPACLYHGHIHTHAVLSPLCLLPGWHSSFSFFSHDDEWCLSSDCSAWNHLIYSLHLGSNYVEVVLPFDIHTVELSTVLTHIFFHSLCHNQLSRVFHIHTDKHSLRWSFWTRTFFLLSSAISSFNTDTDTKMKILRSMQYIDKIQRLCVIPDQISYK